eukprot:1180061-Prorocentrum_minimum.AAC.1
MVRDPWRLEKKLCREAHQPAGGGGGVCTVVTVQTVRLLFDCKPLAFIWEKFPEFYSEKNTIMFDDLRRNFVMNPQV